LLSLTDAHFDIGTIINWTTKCRHAWSIKWFAITIDNAADADGRTPRE